MSNVARVLSDQDGALTACVMAAQFTRSLAADLGLGDPHGRWFQTLAVQLEREAAALTDQPATPAATAPRRLRIVR
jgi:hypothetical protein